MFHTLKQARVALSHLNPGAVRKLAHKRVTIGLVAAGSGEYALMEESLQSAGGASCLFRAEDPSAPSGVDLVLYDQGIPAPEGAYTLYRDDLARTLKEILQDHEDLALPLARRFYGFRKPVVDGIVNLIARENALFALATALPSVIPLVDMPWTLGEWASDTAFLTANQIRMAFLIAAACGKEPSFSNQKAEILSITGGAFGWRAIARELVGKIPLGGGLIPKGAVAFAGTFVTGKSLELLHGARSHYTAEQRRDLYRQALERGRAVAQSLLPA